MGTCPLCGGESSGGICASCDAAPDDVEIEDTSEENSEDK